jgi:hypothetical protein
MKTLAMTWRAYSIFLQVCYALLHIFKPFSLVCCAFICFIRLICGAFAAEERRAFMEKMSANKPSLADIQEPQH